MLRVVPRRTFSPSSAALAKRSSGDLAMHLSMTRVSSLGRRGSMRRSGVKSPPATRYMVSCGVPPRKAGLPLAIS